VRIDEADRATLAARESELAARHAALAAAGLKLDVTRGKPSSAQLDLSDRLDGVLDANYRSDDGTDLRNYGGLDGIPEAKQLFAPVLQVPVDNMLVGGNSSLTLMWQCALYGMHFGFEGPDSAWRNGGPVKFICPVPGYDRHFGICEHLGIEMVTVPMTENGPDMDAVEALIDSDPAIRGMWVVPRFSNPTGAVCDEATVRRCAALGKRAAPGFRLFWDDAYAVHALERDCAETRAAVRGLPKRRHRGQRAAVRLDLQDHARRRGRRVPGGLRGESARRSAITWAFQQHRARTR
jgi:hypothetical protein